MSEELDIMPSKRTDQERCAERYAEVYAWVEAQPCVSQDFVHVPIESLAELLHLPNEKGQP